MPKVEDFLDEFTEAFKEQLKKDHERWGDTWLNRPSKGQESRVINDYIDYFDRFTYGNEPMPWLKIAGNAMIAWIREEHPELFPDG